MVRAGILLLCGALIALFSATGAETRRGAETTRHGQRWSLRNGVLRLRGGATALPVSVATELAVERHIAAAKNASQAPGGVCWGQCLELCARRFAVPFAQRLALLGAKSCECSCLCVCVCV